MKSLGSYVGNPTYEFYAVAKEIPGRLWEGKEYVVEALGGLVAAEPAGFKSPEIVITALLGAYTTPG